MLKLSIEKASMKNSCFLLSDALIEEQYKKFRKQQKDRCIKYAEMMRRGFPHDDHYKDYLRWLEITNYD